MEEVDVTLRVWNALVFMLVSLIIIGQYVVLYRHREVKVPWWTWLPLGLYVLVFAWVFCKDNVEVTINYWEKHHEPEVVKMIKNGDDGNGQWKPEIVEQLKMEAEKNPCPPINIINNKVTDIVKEIKLDDQNT